MNLKKLSTAILSLSIFFVLGAAMVSAQPATGGGSPATGGGNPNTGGGNPDTGGGNPPVGIKVKLENPFKGGDTLFAFIQTIINKLILPIGGILAVLAFIYSGFLYVMAQGNETKLKTAHKALLYTAVGTALLLGAWVFANVICHTLELISGTNFCPTNFNAE